ncbi:hypothetical protein BV898_18119 [Hypsibius exemplaris]|uniref:Uncharacterized protein n=1 Tax=Hypsibius exemplaris TaxID=2072580 RepID=A0A9X6NGM8_HYPEX|nr:hypothetical protein BV898_18119 [Hypsibius exemplaris]
MRIAHGVRAHCPLRLSSQRRVISSRKGENSFIMATVKAVSDDKATKTAAELEEEEEEEEGAEGEEQPGTAEGKKKKKKRNRRKKSATAGGAKTDTPSGCNEGSGRRDSLRPSNGRNHQARCRNSRLGLARLVRIPGFPKEQTYPPRKPINEIFKNGKYTPGEEVTHGTPRGGIKDSTRSSGAEAKMSEAMNEEMYQELRRAAEAHRQTRKYVQNFIKPGNDHDRNL